jgi:hypothetical protein
MCPPALNTAFEVGHTLKVANNGTWARFTDAPGNYNYVWLRDGAPLVSYNGAPIGIGACQVSDGNSYVIQQDDVGHKLSCQVTALNHDGTGAGSAVTDAVTVAAAPLLGTREIGPGSSQLSAGSAEAYRATAAAGGTFSALDVYVEKGTTARWLIAGVYADDGTGDHPGALIGQNDIELGSHSAAAGWETVPLSGITVTGGTKYWIALLPAGGVMNIRNHDGGTGDEPSETSRSTRLTSLPAAWRTGTVYKKDGPLTAASSSEGSAT